MNQNFRYPWYVVAVLMLAYISSFIDRQILSLLVEPIKSDFNLSDTQVGSLMGLSFALFYTVLGIPIGRMADYANRRNIIIWGIGIWSLMTAACGACGNFIQFFLARMGVGVGEAALSPAAYSIITDYFPKEKRATAMSVYGMGIFLGSGIAILIGGAVLKLKAVQEMTVLPLIGEVFPWQVIFFFIGLPGLLIMLLMLTVKEPARTGTVTVSEISLKVALRGIFTNKAFIWHSLAFGFISMVSYGSTGWIPTLFIRKFGWTSSQIGVKFGLIVAIFSTLGVVTGGIVADRLVKNGKTDGKLRTGIIAAVGIIAFGFYTLLGDPNFVLLALCGSCFFCGFPFGAAPAAVQEMMPSQMRATASAVYLFIQNLVGLGLGPLLVGVLNDRLFHDPNKVGYSLLILIIVGCALGLGCLAMALKPYRENLLRLNQ